MNKTLIAIFIGLVVVGGLGYWANTRNIENSLSAGKTEENGNIINKTEKVAEKEKYIIPDVWATYTNTAYKYSFSYPRVSLTDTDLPTFIAANLDRDIGKVSAEESSAIAVAYLSSFLLRVDVVGDFSNKLLSDFYGIDNVNFNIKELSQKFWGFNKFDDNPNTAGKSVSDFEEITLGEKDAFKFSTTKSFSTGDGGYILNPSEEHVFIFVANGKLAFRISYPKSNEDVAKKILSTFRFLN